MENTRKPKTYRENQFSRTCRKNEQRKLREQNFIFKNLKVIPKNEGCEPSDWMDMLTPECRE